MQFYVTAFEPGPFDHSYYFVMSPGPQDESIALSQNVGVMQDTDDNGKADCFILGGGTLSDEAVRFAVVIRRKSQGI